MRFALSDFGTSVVFPPETPQSKRVCPAGESEWGYPYFHPPDVSPAQTTYDPFTYDVACMGGFLCDTTGVRMAFLHSILKLIRLELVHDTIGSSVGSLSRSTHYP